MKAIICIFFCLASCSINAQELFVFSEPASNMSAKSLGARLTNSIMQESSSKNLNWHIYPEMMWGISARFMIHTELFLSTRNSGMDWEGGALYGKYRFYSSDGIHQHVRMAVFSKLAFNNSVLHQPAIDLNGHNSGYEAGLIITGLKNKLAVSGTVSLLHATDNANSNYWNLEHQSRESVSYQAAIGKLVLPVKYTGYEQTNMNLMFEMMGQVNLGSGEAYLDLAPSVQFVFFSQARLDIGYRFPVQTSLYRTATKGALIRLEYNFFNILSRKKSNNKKG